VGVGSVNERRGVYVPAMRTECASMAMWVRGIGGIGEGFWNMRCSRWRLGGHTSVSEGDGSGVNMPLSYRPSPGVGISGAGHRVREGCRGRNCAEAEVDVFGLGTGDEVVRSRGMEREQLVVRLPLHRRDSGSLF